MAEQQQNVNIAAPGFLGLNTQLSPTELPHPFASIADQCVIDKEGRVAVRNGLQLNTQNGSELINGTEQPVKQVREFFGDDGEAIVFCVGNEKIFQTDLATGTLTEMTTTPAFAGDNWQIIPANNQCFFVQEGTYPRVYDHSVGGTALTTLSDPTSGPANLPPLSEANCALYAFGRLWLGGFTSDKSVVAWSAIGDGTDFELASGAGTIDLSDAWPKGNDSVRALAVHNDYLIIFGQRSILVYDVPSGGASVSSVGPAYMTLEDTVSGFGCVARDSVVSVGTDLYFLDSSGLRSFARTIQEKSLPLGDVSAAIQKDIKASISREGPPDCPNIRAFYDIEDATYYLIFPTTDEVYLFDMTFAGVDPMPSRITRWPDTGMTCGFHSSANQDYFGGPGGLYTYTGYVDKVSTGGGDGSTTDSAIPWKYYTHPLDFESHAREKFLKQVDAVLVGDSTQDVALYWAFDYRKATSNTLTENITFSEVAEYLTALYGVDEYSGAGVESLKLIYWNVWGSGRNVRMGWESDVNGTLLAIQEINIQATIGRLI